MPGGKALVVFFLMLLAADCFAAEIENSARTGFVAATVAVEGTGRISGSLHGTTARIEILSFRETDSQSILSLNESLEINGKTIGAKRSHDEWGNSYALFEVGEAGSFSYRIEAIIQNKASFEPIPEYDLAGEISSFDEFLEPSENIESNHESIRTLAFNRFGGNSWLETVADATQWVHESVEYDLSYYPGIYSALETLETRKGVCDEFAVLEAAILRARGIPVRLASGLAFNSQAGKGWNNHAWLEAFSPSAGWLSFDPTFGEAGVVDATHIVRGYFPDPADSSISKSTVAETAKVELEEKTAEVEVETAAPFDRVFSIEANNVVMPANTWHELSINAENSLNGNAIGWFSMVLPEGFLSDGKRRIVVFREGEEKELSWETRVDIELKENEYLSGSYKVVSPSQEIKKDIKVMPQANFVEEALIELVDLVPVAEENNLVIEVILENRGSKAGTASVQVGEVSETVEIGGLERKTVTVSIPSSEGQSHKITVSGPGLSYETTLTMQEGRPVAKNGNPPDTSETSLFGGIEESLFSLEAGILAGIVVGIAVIVLLLKALLSK